MIKWLTRLKVKVVLYLETLTTSWKLTILTCLSILDIFAMISRVSRRNVPPRFRKSLGDPDKYVQIYISSCLKTEIIILFVLWRRWNVYIFRHNPAVVQQRRNITVFQPANFHSITGRKIKSKGCQCSEKSRARDNSPVNAEP